MRKTIKKSRPLRSGYRGDILNRGSRNLYNIISSYNIVNNYLEQERIRRERELYNINKINSIEKIKEYNDIIGDLLEEDIFARSFPPEGYYIRYLLNFPNFKEDVNNFLNYNNINDLKKLYLMKELEDYIISYYRLELSKLSLPGDLLELISNNL